MAAACGDALALEIRGRQIALAWLSNGCDMGLDVIPTLTARSRGKPPRSIVSWKYFDQAVREARDRRAGPAPKAGNGALGETAQRHLALLRTIRPKCAM